MRNLTQGKIIVAVVILFVIVAILQGGVGVGLPDWFYGLGSDGWSTDNVFQRLETFTKDISQTWHPWGASFWQALAVYLGLMLFVTVVVKLKLASDDGLVFWTSLVVAVAYVAVAALSWVVIPVLDFVLSRTTT